MKKIIKITLITFLFLGVVGFVFFAYSVSDWLTEFDDAFLFVEGQEGLSLKINPCMVTTMHTFLFNYTVLSTRYT